MIFQHTLESKKFTPDSKANNCMRKFYCIFSSRSEFWEKPRIGLNAVNNNFLTSGPISKQKETLIKSYEKSWKICSCCFVLNLPCSKKIGPRTCLIFAQYSGIHRIKVSTVQSHQKVTETEMVLCRIQRQKKRFSGYEFPKHSELPEKCQLKKVSWELLIFTMFFLEICVTTIPKARIELRILPLI